MTDEVQFSLGRESAPLLHHISRSIVTRDGRVAVLAKMLIDELLSDILDTYPPLPEGLVVVDHDDYEEFGWHKEGYVYQGPDTVRQLGSVSDLGRWNIRPYPPTKEDA